MSKQATRIYVRMYNTGTATYLHVCVCIYTIQCTDFTWVRKRGTSEVSTGLFYHTQHTAQSQQKLSHVSESTFWYPEVEGCLSTLKSHADGLLVPLTLSLVAPSTRLSPPRSRATPNSHRLYKSQTLPWKPQTNNM